MNESGQIFEKACILRHDIDVSIDCALDMALVEHSFGVKSTFFFMITSDYYNIFEIQNRRKLKKISALGHEIGLHWDSNFSPLVDTDFSSFFENQLKMLGSIVGEEIMSVSQHIPTDTPYLDLEKLVRFNAYSEDLQRRFKYISDSSMVFRDANPFELIEQEVSFQFLSHPVWWFIRGRTREQKIIKLSEKLKIKIDFQAKKFVKYVENHLKERKKFDKEFRRKFNV